MKKVFCSEKLKNMKNQNVVYRQPINHGHYVKKVDFQNMYENGTKTTIFHAG